MNQDNISKPLRSRQYVAADQEVFAILSGDRNPLHMDAVAARRTLIGAPAVHGVNLALTALEFLLERQGREIQLPVAVKTFAARFLKSVLVGERVHFQLTKQTAGHCQVDGSVDGATVVRVSIDLERDAVRRPDAPLPSLASEPLAQPAFEGLEGLAGDMALGLDAELAHQLFPRVLESLGATGMGELLALTRLVGMRCPGLHSLFASLDVRFDGRGTPGLLQYRVEEADPRFRRLRIEVTGPQLNGSLLAYDRLPPVMQQETAEVARVVLPNSFSDSVALIVGGSRGIGEITAKAIAAGGGLPIISYFQGSADAERVARDIHGWGGRCEVIRLDVRRSLASVRQLFRGAMAPRSLYYFATPKISGRRRSFFSYDMLEEFNEYYVSAFGHLIDTASAVTKTKLRVFYPSSAFVEEGTRETAEYSISKRAAEEVCAFYNRYSDKVRIIIERLPAIRTDQNIALLPVALDDALKVMLPIIRRMEEVS